MGMMQLAEDRGVPSQSNQFQLEPDLLPVMQMLFTLQAVLQSAGLMIVLVQERFIPTLLVLELLALGILLIYVYWPGLPDRLGRAFLPPVVIYYSALAIIQRYLFVAFVLPEVVRPPGGAPGERMMILDSGWSLLVALLIPLVLVAWQYDFPHVLWYCAGITLFELPLMVLAPHPAQITFFDMLTMVGMRAVVFAMVGYIVTRMIGAQRAQRHDLTEANARLQHAATTLEQLTISRERNRMARELHDTLAHSLSAVAVQLEAVDSALDSAPETAHVLLTKALAQTRTGLTETRRAMHALRASPLEDLGLPLALQNLAQSTARRSGMTLDIQLPTTPPNLAPNMEQGIYRIAQEALTNVARHADATHLAVSLQCNGAIALTIQDNGRGFDVSSIDAGGHFGLQGMRERADMMNATLDIQSTAGCGATVRLVAKQLDGERG